MVFFYLADDDFANEDSDRPDFANDESIYEEPCEECGGKVWSTGGRGYYNGSYQCYTMYLECENCGPYEVECV